MNRLVLGPENTNEFLIFLLVICRINIFELFFLPFSINVWIKQTSNEAFTSSMNTYYDYSIYVSLVVAITDIPTVWVSLVTSWFSDTVGLFVVSKDLGRDFLVDVGCRV